MSLTTQAILLLIFSVASSTGRPVLESQTPHTNDAGAKSKQAYVTLLYGNDFLLGVRTLGQSIQESSTDRCVRIFNCYSYVSYTPMD